MWKGRLLIVAAAVIAYLPALNNDFIADDWVILHRVEVLKVDPLYLNESVPENFRLTSYVVFALLKTAFGYHATPYYVFNILLHALNCLMLSAIVRTISGEDAVALLSGLMMAVFQAPQEAVMWLAAMNETLSAFFIFATFLLWFHGHRVPATLTFAAALYSKESAVILIVLLPLVEWMRGRRASLTDYWILAAPASVFVILFLSTLSANFQVGQGTYALSFRGALVLLKSLHRLFWPWGYAIALAAIVANRGKLSWRFPGWAALIPVTMLPYIFVTYTNNIPSRQTYLASAVFAPLLAAGILSLHTKTWRAVMAAGFIAGNMIYMWTVKDSQMEARALPTTALAKVLHQFSPQDMRIRGFEYPVDLIVKGVAVSLPGWSWD
ncbi:MAG TPA: hypothetical protein VFR18_13140, partial [Terriglobia bacterium]|nr:hypothetical protein [Terriglobia bacterium]